MLMDIFYQTRFMINRSDYVHFFFSTENGRALCVIEIYVYFSGFIWRDNSWDEIH